jgi:hypothetical protein
MSAATEAMLSFQNLTCFEAVVLTAAAPESLTTAAATSITTTMVSIVASRNSSRNVSSNRSHAILQNLTCFEAAVLTAAAA